MEEISYFWIDPFTLFYLELPTNSYMIACTDTQGFEEGENCALPSRWSTLLDLIWNLLDLILLGSRDQEISVPLVFVLINFGVKKQVQKISFKGFEEA